ncbi:MAG: hypothetical protein KA712_05810 [Myxococcales bacterium]|nr:hypothetical protein [Myxococcales bacterium]
MLAFMFLAALVGFVCIQFAALILFIRMQDPLDRVLVLEFVALVLVGVLAALSLVKRAPYYLDAAMLVALLSFVATLAAVRWLQGGQVLR